MARMKIFNTLEEEAFESPPEFNSGERKRFFSLSLLLKESQASLRTPTNKVCFLVAAGYFKARGSRCWNGTPAQRAAWAPCGGRCPWYELRITVRNVTR